MKPPPAILVDRHAPHLI